MISMPAYFHYFLVIFVQITLLFVSFLLNLQKILNFNVTKT